MTKKLQNRDLENSVTSVYQKKKRKSVKNRVLSQVSLLPGGQASAIYGSNADFVSDSRRYVYIHI